MERTFAEVWKDGHRERNEYFVSIFAAIWSLLTVRRLQAKEARAFAKAYDLKHRDLAKAA